MTDDASLYSRAGEIFIEIADLDEDARVRALDEACAGDEALRARVVALLEHDREPAAPARLDALALRLSGEFEAIVEDAAPGSDGAELEVRSPRGYRFLHRLGTGGMGAVYLAEQENPRRRVACKVILPWAADAVGQQRFEREIEALGRLRDPSITQIHEAGTVETPLGARPFFSMELVEGPDIVRHAAELELTLAQRLELFVPVCDAVQHAHEQGVIHRDLKPANILVDRTRSPRAKVLDFGVARVVGAATEGATLSGDNRLFGTLPYMSPEQAAGEGARIGPPADVYGLGAVLYQLVAGRSPLDLSGLGITESVAKIREVEPLPLTTSVAGDVPRDLSVIVTKALEKEPADRYPSAAALAEDLRRLLADRPISARPPGRVERFTRFARKNRVLVGGVVATLLVATVGAVVATLFALDARDAERVAVEGEQEARRLAYRAEIGAGLALADDFPHIARAHLDACAEDLRGWEWRHLASRLDVATSIVPLERASDDGPLAVAWGSDGVPFAVVADGATVTVVEGASGRVRARWTHPGRVRRLVLSSDARLVGSLAERESGFTLLVREVRTGTVLLDETFEAPPGSVGDLEITDDGRRAFVLLDDGVREVDDGGARRIEVGTGRVRDLATRGDGARLWVGRDYRVGRLSRLVDGRPGAEVTMASPHVVMATADAVFTVDPHRRVARHDATTLEVACEYDGHSRSPHQLAVSADGRVLASASDDGSVRVWDVATGRCHATLPVSARAVAVSADGARLALVTSRELQVVEWKARGENVVLRHDDYLHAAEFCHDGRVVVTAGAGTVLWFWDAATGRRLATVDQGDSSSSIRSLAVSRDGTRVVATAVWRQLVIDAASLTTRKLDARAMSTFPLRAGARVKFVGGATATVHDGASWRTKGAELRGADDRAVLRADGTIVSFDIARGGRRIALSVGPRLIVASWPDGRTLGEGRHLDLVYSVAFSPDGARVATASNDTTWRLFSVAPVRELARFQAHDSYVHSASWSPDGTRVVTAGGDGRAILWDSRPLAERAAERAADERLRSEIRPEVRRLLDEEGAAEAARRLREDPGLDRERRSAALYCLLELVGGR